MKKQYVSGFTLVELIVVIAIIGVLAAILVPSLIGYVRKAQLSSDCASAKEMYNEFSLMLTDEKEYQVGSSTTWQTVSECYYKTKFKTKHRVTINGETYIIHIVAKVAGSDPARSQSKTNGFYHWNGNSPEGDPIFSALDEHFMYSASGEYRIKKQSKTYDNNHTDMWMLCYREENGVEYRDQLEIWAGDSTGDYASQPRYRLYPDPCPVTSSLKLP